ncbi:MAG: SAM-dependent methyltransferase [Lentimicrobiaceae bacterium]|nr:SAM-dependent methyltransferase [Lentimicrobiaceae bacterium]
MQKFINKLESSLKDGSFVKLTLSKPDKSHVETYGRMSADIRNVYVKPIILRNEKMYSFTYRYERRDETKNYDAQQSLEVITNLISEIFLNATLFTLTEDVTLLISKKGKTTVMTKAVKEQREQNVEHDKVKNRLINPENPWWFKLGLTTRDGKVTADMQHKFKQICKYVEIVDGVMKNVKFDGKIRIADMGAGKGYLTLALYEYLTQKCKYDIAMEGVEIRPDLVAKINEIIKESNLKDFRFVESSIDSYQLSAISCQLPIANNQQPTANSQLDILIALHACNTATDDAIIKGIESGAKLIICAPCCHKQIRQEMEKSKVVDAITRYGIFMERQAVMITDTIRALILEYFGYKTQVMEFIEMEHTPKNVLLVGRKTNEPSAEEKEAVLKEINNLKERYGIEKHYLEKVFVMNNEQ